MSLAVSVMARSLRSLLLMPPFPLQPQQLVPSCSQVNNCVIPTRAQTSLLHHKEGESCAVSIFRYHVYVSTRPSQIEKNQDRANEVTTIPVEVM